MKEHYIKTWKISREHIYIYLYKLEPCRINDQQKQLLYKYICIMPYKALCQLRGIRLGAAVWALPIGHRRLGAGHLGAWTIGRQVFFSFIFL